MDDNQKTTPNQIVSILILTLILSITGTTYAYFTISSNNNNTITGNAATVSLGLDVTKIYPTESSDNTGVIVPQLSVSNNANSPLNNALKEGCVDANKNIVCQVYKVNINSNGSSAVQVIDGTVSFFSNPELTIDAGVEIPNLKWRVVNSVDETTATNSILGANPDNSANSTKGVFADDIIFNPDINRDYYIIVWLNEANRSQDIDAGKTFYGLVEAIASNGTGCTASFAS